MQNTSTYLKFLIIPFLFFTHSLFAQQVSGKKINKTDSVKAEDFKISDKLQKEAIIKDAFNNYSSKERREANPNQSEINSFANDKASDDKLLLKKKDFAREIKTDVKSKDDKFNN